MNIGIDKLAYYIPKYYLEMEDLAKARGVDPNKFIKGLGQDKMAVVPITQDTITMGANAAHKILNEDDKKAIDMVILCTETGLDFSKAGAAVIHKMLGINPFARSIEFKQACYSATAGIQLGKDYVASHPGRKVLVVASDISRYGLQSSGEPTQGAGAVAMLISENPKVLKLDHDTTFFTDDINDFWRPIYSDVALVDGKYSNEEYQRLFTTTMKAHFERFNKSLEDYTALTFHIPYTKMGLKALKLIADENQHPHLFSNFQLSTTYNRLVGNVYTASLYLSIISLLVKGDLKSGDSIGMFSYGSGAVGEFFAGIVQEGYKDHILIQDDELNSRIKLSVKEYESMYGSKPNSEGMHQIFDTSNETSEFYLKEIKNHVRIYNK